MTESVDHLVVAAPDLATGVSHVEGLLGRRAVIGGRHPHWGTHNAIVGLGRGMYLEIIAADPERDRSDPVTIFGLDRVRTPQLVTWAAKARDLESHHARAKDAGIELGAILEGEGSVQTDPGCRGGLQTPRSRSPRASSRSSLTGGTPSTQRTAFHRQGDCRNCAQSIRAQRACNAYSKRWVSICESIERTEAA